MPNDTAPAWPDPKKPRHPPHAKGAWSATSLPSQGADEPRICLTPAEVAAREAAAFAAGAEAMREMAAQYADKEAAYSSKRADSENHHDQVWFSSSEATAGSIASHVRALPLPPMPGQPQGGGDAG